MYSKAEDTWKLCDFGVSTRKVMSLKTDIGTTYYQAPEIVENAKYDKSVDIFALGLVFLELYLGKRITLIF